MNTDLKAPRYLPHLTQWALECWGLRPPQGARTDAAGSMW